MKKKELKELHSKSAKELENLIAKKREEISKVKLESFAGKEQNTRKHKILRHELAQMLTINAQKSKEVSEK